MRFYANSNTGQFGPLWWINGIHHAHETEGFYGLTGNLSRHRVWRQGGCGLELFGRFWSISRTKWHIIEALN